MSTIDNTVNMTIRIDKDFKKQMDKLFKDLGINTSSAIMMFLKQCYREKGLPFVASLEIPNKRLLGALKESEDIVNGKIEAKEYDSFEDLVKDID